jgi:hypothetical protein
MRAFDLKSGQKFCDFAAKTKQILHGFCPFRAYFTAKNTLSQESYQQSLFCRQIVCL